MRGMKYFWALPNTCVGMFFVPLARRWQWVDGALEIHGGAVSWFLRHCTVLKGGAAAMTLGHIVLGLDQAVLDKTRNHERVHVRQCERWGPLFLPAYLLCSLYLFVRRRDAYWDNPFEIDARRNN
jgi:hypothetical protein